MPPTFPRKLLVCFLTGLLGAFALVEVGRKVFAPWLGALHVAGAVIVGSALLLAGIWQYTARRHPRASAAILAGCHGAMSYFIAVTLAMFAWRKIFWLQFYAPRALLDKPVSDLSGEQLTIAYFAYSHPFGVCLAGFQLLGSALLLFHRTRLLGVFVLLPVVTNIILIDWFYHVAAGVLVLALVLLAGLLYLLLLDYARVKAFFFAARRHLAPYPRPAALTHLVRASALLVPLAACVALYDVPHRHPGITGKFAVTRLFRNGHPVARPSCTDSTLTAVYIDDNHDIVCERNSPRHWWVGHFTYDTRTTRLDVVWRYPRNFHDSLSATLTPTQPTGVLTLQGIMGRDTLKAELLRIK